MMMKEILKMPQPLPYMAFPVYPSHQILPSGLDKNISTSICHLLINQSRKSKQGTPSTAAEKSVTRKG